MCVGIGRLQHDGEHDQNPGDDYHHWRRQQAKANVAAGENHSCERDIFCQRVNELKVLNEGAWLFLLHGLSLVKCQHSIRQSFAAAISEQMAAEITNRLDLKIVVRPATLQRGKYSRVHVVAGLLAA